MFVKLLLTVTNTSNVDGFFTISYGYGVFGNVDNEGGFTHDAWTVGNVDTTFNLIPQGVETQDHQCVGGQFGSECQNFYDFNDYDAFSYEIPAGQVNTVDMLINVQLFATTVPEPTPFAMITSVLLVILVAATVTQLRTGFQYRRPLGMLRRQRRGTRTWLMAT